MLKVGLIGCGGMGMCHVDCYTMLKDKVEVLYVADLCPEKVEKASERLGAKALKDGNELLLHASELDFIDICLPTYLHTDYAVRAMEAGCHVFMEKPVCLNMDEAKLLLDTQAKTNKKVQVGQVIRYWPEYVWLKEAVDSGKYGKVLSATFERLSTNPKWAWENWFNDPAKSGSAALDLHIHDVDFVCYMMGGQPDEISSKCARNSEGVLQQIFTNYMYGDTMIHLEGGWDYHDYFPFAMKFRVKMEKATVVYDEKGLNVYQDGCESFAPDIAVEATGTNTAGINVQGIAGYYNEIKDFIECIENDTMPKIAPLSEAVKSLEVALKEIESAGGLVK